MAKDHFKADVLIIPGEGGGRGGGGGCTFITQPIDKCIKKPFKESIRQSWQEWMHQDRVKTKQGNVKKPTHQDVINWVSKAWESIKKRDNRELIFCLRNLKCT